MADKFERKKLDYMILGLIKKGIGKTHDIFKQLPDFSRVEIIERISVMEKQRLLLPDKNEGWWIRNMNPTISLTDEGKIEIDKKLKK